MLEEDEQDLVGVLDRMHEEAAETESRCTEAAGQFDGKKTAILEEAREVKQEAIEMMKTYLEDEEEALDGFESHDGRGGRGRTLGDRQEAQRASG